MARWHLNEFTAITMPNTRAMSQAFRNWCDQNSLTGVLNKHLEADGTIKPQYVTMVWKMATNKQWRYTGGIATITWS
eukprot:5598436-Amphidinium_carterae.1